MMNLEVMLKELLMLKFEKDTDVFIFFPLTQWSFKATLLDFDIFGEHLNLIHVVNVKIRTWCDKPILFITCCCDDTLDVPTFFSRINPGAPLR